ncbi:hypothetical protein [Pseudomonas leptonychotis]|uniref:hypothetical protein n=1 Tax=Pseudomonas leptonychotis TaxID=2448482 RepID=UPI0039EFE443
MKFVATLSTLIFLLTSCALFEPTASEKFITAPDTSTEALFTCAEAAISALHKESAQWRLDVTSRNLQNGLFETNNFKDSNITGIRAQIKYNKASNTGSITVKASGPYFVDLGADHAATTLKYEIIQCMAPN